MLVLNWVIFSTKDFADKPFAEPFVTHGGWQEEKRVYGKVAVGLKCVRISLGLLAC